MRLFCTLFLVLGSLIVHATDKTSVDSLLKLAYMTHDSYQKISAYRNLADIYFEAPKEKIYLKKIISEAKKLNDKEIMLNSLSELTFAFIRDEQDDSTFYYMNVIRQNSPKEKGNRFLSYLRMRLFDMKIYSKDADKAINEKLILPKGEKYDIYTDVEYAYITGTGLKVHKKPKEAIPYLETAYQASLKLPCVDKYSYQRLILSSLASCYAVVQMHKECINTEEKLIEVYKINYDEFYKGKRPFFNINSRYIQIYAYLTTQFEYLSETKKNYYISQILEFKKQATDPYDKYNIFFALNNHYSIQKKYSKALSYNDSLIKYAQIIAPYNIPSLHKTQSSLYELIDNYQKALQHYKIYNNLEDSMSSAETFEKINELQIKYDVDKLNYEKTQLEIKNKKIILICLSLILFITIAVCAYLYYNLKKEKQLKNTLNKLYVKAEESEKMKIAFINSMCHEIRTPLNAIAGFSEVITDEELESDSKKEFSGLIKSNAYILASLIDHLLEIANLDSSQEKLVCELANINEICKQEMKKLKEKAKEDVEYKLEIPQDEIFISTNVKYLSLVIENLLTNADKFTPKGNITLGFHVDNAKNIIQIHVTDTGCGIPVEKHEIVFQRFAKLDSFSQGNGLGLYLSRLIIKRLSGEIYIDPNYTQGARIVINLSVHT